MKNICNSENHPFNNFDIRAWFVFESSESHLIPVVFNFAVDKTYDKGLLSE